MKIIFELYKNMKIIFRSWSSISLLILGPLLLILLIGWAFSGDAIHDINIGMVGASDTIEPLVENMSSYAKITKYITTDSCIEDMKIERIHICLKFSEDFIKAKQDIPTGEITFFYDNTRSKLTSEIVNNIQEFLGVTAEQISIQAASSIFDNIQQLVLFLRERTADIDSLQQESVSMRQDLVERRAKLIEVRTEFLPSYNKLKEFQDIINESTENISQDIKETNQLIKDVKSITANLESYSNQILRLIDTPSSLYITSSYASFTAPVFDDYEVYNMSQINIVNISGYTLNLEYPNIEILNISTTSADLTNLSDEQILGILLTTFSARLKELDSTLDSLSANIENTNQQFKKSRTEFNSIIAEIDQIKIMLDQEIENTDKYITEIDEANIRISDIKEQLEKGLDKLAFINPELAEKLIKPILQTYEPLKPDVKNIKLVFPLLLSVVIIFISMLFANIVTLSEIHSKAFFRNLIAPVKDINYTLGLIITNYIVIFFQVIILLLVAQYNFHISIFGNFGPLFIIFSLLSLIFIFMGMTFAYFFKNEQTSILTTTFVALAFFLFSDVVTPLELMPSLATFFASLNPIVLTTKIFKQLLIFNIPLASMTKEVLILIAYIIIMWIILIIASKKSRSRR